MIVVPHNPDQLGEMLIFLHEHAGVEPSITTHVIGWEDGGELRIVVGLGSWLGKTCQMHVAFAPNWHFSPREMLRNCFRHAFVKCEREMVLGIVNSRNKRAIDYDLHLGFTEIGRIAGMHDDGGDIVVLGMTRAQCRYLDDPKLAGEEHAGITGHA